MGGTISTSVRRRGVAENSTTQTDKVINSFSLPETTVIVGRWVAVTIIVLSFFYVPWSIDRLFLPKVTAVRLLAFGLLAVVAVRSAVGARRLVVSSVTWPAIGLLALLSLSTWSSSHFYASVMGLWPSYQGVLTLLPLILMFVLVQQTKWHSADVRRIFLVAGACAGIVAVLGIVQALRLTAFPLSTPLRFAGKPVAFFGNPNVVAQYLVILLPIVVALAAAEKKSLSRLLLGILAAIMIVNVLMSRSMGGMLGLIMIAVAWAASRYVMSESRRRWSSAVFGFSLGALGLVVAASVAILSRYDLVSLGSRLRVWRASLKVIAAYPWFGTGPDTLYYILPAYLRNNPLYNGEVFRDSHNALLTIAASMGIFTAVLFVLLVALVMARGWKYVRRGEEGRLLAEGLMLAIIGWMAAISVNPDNIVSATLFWIFLGLLAGLSRQEPVQVAASVPSMVLAGFLIALSLTGAWYSGKVMATDMLLFKGREARSYRQALTYFRKAHLYDRQSSKPYVLAMTYLRERVPEDSSREGAEKIAYRSLALPSLSDSWDYEAVFYLGMYHFDQVFLKPAEGRLAIKEFQRSLRLRPRNPLAIEGLAKVNTLLGRKRQARHFERLYRRITGDVSFSIAERLSRRDFILETPGQYVTLAKLFLRMKKNRQAANTLRAGLKVYGNNEVLLRMLAVTYRSIGRDDAADYLLTRLDHLKERRTDHRLQLRVDKNQFKVINWHKAK